MDGESCLWAIAGLLRLANNAKPNPLGVASGRSVDFRVSVAGPKAIGCREAVVLRNQVNVTVGEVMFQQRSRALALAEEESAETPPGDRPMREP